LCDGHTASDDVVVCLPVPSANTHSKQVPVAAVVASALCNINIQRPSVRRHVRASVVNNLTVRRSVGPRHAARYGNAHGGRRLAQSNPFGRASPHGLRSPARKTAQAGRRRSSRGTWTTSGGSVQRSKSSSRRMRNPLARSLVIAKLTFSRPVGQNGQPVAGHLVTPGRD